MNAENFVVFFLGDDFDEAVGFPQDARFAGCRKWKFTDLYVVAFFARFGFGQAIIRSRADR